MNIKCAGFNKVKKNKILRIDTIRQELCKPEKREQQIELDEEQEVDHYEKLLISDIKEEELKPGYMQMKKSSILSDIDKYVQYKQNPTGNCELKVKVPEERYGTHMYKKLQDGERDQGNKF